MSGLRQLHSTSSPEERVDETAADEAEASVVNLRRELQTLQQRCDTFKSNELPSSQTLSKVTEMFKKLEAEHLHFAELFPKSIPWDQFGCAFFMLCLEKAKVVIATLSDQICSETQVCCKFQTSEAFAAVLSTNVNLSLQQHTSQFLSSLEKEVKTEHKIFEQSFELQLESKEKEDALLFLKNCLKTALEIALLDHEVIVDVDTSGAFRTELLKLTQKSGSEKRRIRSIEYFSWPALLVSCVEGGYKTVVKGSACGSPALPDTIRKPMLEYFLGIITQLKDYNANQKSQLTQQGFLLQRAFSDLGSTEQSSAVLAQGTTVNQTRPINPAEDALGNTASQPQMRRPAAEQQHKIESEVQEIIAPLKQDLQVVQQQKHQLKKEKERLERKISELTSERLDRFSSFQSLDDPNRKEKLISRYRKLENKERAQLVDKDPDEDYTVDRETCQLMMASFDAARHCFTEVATETSKAVAACLYFTMHSLTAGTDCIEAQPSECLKTVLKEDVRIAAKKSRDAETPLQRIKEAVETVSECIDSKLKLKSLGHSAKAIEAFLNESANICWYMALCDSELMLEASRSVAFSREKHQLVPTCSVRVRQVQSVKYYTWPTLLVGKEGERQVAVKGWVYGSKEPPNDIQSTHAGNQTHSVAEQMEVEAEDLPEESPLSPSHEGDKRIGSANASTQSPTTASVHSFQTTSPSLQPMPYLNHRF